MADLKAPAVQRYIDALKTRSLDNRKFYFPDQEEVIRAVDELFSLMERIKPCENERLRKLWLRVPRGTIEDYGDFEDANAFNDYASFDDYADEWKSFFPEETMWFELDCVEDPDIHFRTVFLNRNMVFVGNERDDSKNINVEAAEFFQWLCDAVRGCISELKAGTYNATVSSSIPVVKRTGLISRKNYWDILQDERKEFQRGFPVSSYEKYFDLIKDQNAEYDSDGRLPQMTADLFFTACSYGYAANPHEYDISGMTAREQYYRFADGRDDGLSEIQSDSPEAFRWWLKERESRGGHPFEVMAGGNSTHVSLYVHCDENGYFFSLAGRSVVRTAETLNFYLALREHKLPVFLFDSELFKRRLLETEMIGVVPEDVTPRYCESMFPGDEVHAFMQLPWEEPEKSLVAAKCEWFPEPEAELKEDTE